MPHTKEHKEDKKKKSVGGGGSWIKHVQEFAKKNNMKYGEALKKAGATYKKK